jgi:hypothetical protein
MYRAVTRVTYRHLSRSTTAASTVWFQGRALRGCSFGRACGRRFALSFHRPDARAGRATEHYARTRPRARRTQGSVRGGGRLRPEALSTILKSATSRGRYSYLSSSGSRTRKQNDPPNAATALRGGITSSSPLAIQRLFADGMGRKTMAAMEFVLAKPVGRRLGRRPSTDQTTHLARGAAVDVGRSLGARLLGDPWLDLWGMVGHTRPPPG